MNKLNIAFIWHMHQPLYKDKITDTYLMPWVRLHAIKDYLDMVVMLENYTNIKQTFNIVPSLIEQLEDYAENNAIDNYLTLSKTPVSELTIEQKAAIMEFFFDLNYEKMVYKFPRYREILSKRESLLKHDDYHKYINVARHFSNQEILDLTVWFNIAWFDYIWQKTEPEIAILIQKDRNFTEEDRKVVLDKQIEIIKRIIPEYKRLLNDGTIEVTASPYYHPILPLLCDTDSAKVAVPFLPLPKNNYKFAKDANIQIKKGIDKYVQCFGKQPKGFWPSEQSLSPETLPLLADNNVKWVVSDEGILFNSIGYYPQRDGENIFTDPRVLYQPYLLEESGNKVAAVFRDIYLSDLIGFTYSKFEPHYAAYHFYTKIKNIQNRLDNNYPYLVTIALDGENCWEYYENDGYDFLMAFYNYISQDESLNMTTVSEYLENHPPQKSIKHLFSGSWIHSNFTTWIGDPTKNKAWDSLFYARKELEDFEQANPNDKEVLEKAWEEIYIAEGSDWFWWFGEGHSSTHDALFDWQFRLHLQNVYKLIGKAVPSYLKNSLYSAERVSSLPDHLFKDGWLNCHAYNFESNVGTMNQLGKVFERIYYGHDSNNIKIRVEHSSFYEYSEGDSFEIYLKLTKRDDLPQKSILEEEHVLQLKYQSNYKIFINGVNGIYRVDENNNWEKFGTSNFVSTKDFFELSIPFTTLGLKNCEDFSFIIVAYKGKHIQEFTHHEIKYKHSL